MFAKGPMPGATPKADALKVWPGATCHYKEALGGIRGYVVYAADGKAIASAANAQEAWRKASQAKRHG
jgi:hypothetical protein